MPKRVTSEELAGLLMTITSNWDQRWRSPGLLHTHLISPRWASSPPLSPRSRAP